MQLLKTTVVTGALLLSLVQLGAAEPETSASCKGQVNCATCVSAHPYCAWCKTERSPEFRNNHCDILAAVQSFCPPGDIVFPQANITVVTNTSLSEQQSPSQPIQPIQVAPQHLRLRLKPHDPVKFEVQFRQVADYPLDLYYLMDLTDTMREDKALLESLGEEMAMTLRGLTKNFRLGFGSFVDKPVMPYVSQVPDNKKNPCSLYGACVPAYGFRHHLNLSNHVYQFTEKMRAVQVSGNIDNLEGGLDALVQVATCADVIGWNQKSRKLIIYTSDGQFHLAGEGLLGGAVERNELRCQLDDNGYYTQTTTHDYPSVAELDRVLRTENMNVVFAVTGQYKIQYDRLVKIMKSNVQVASLLDDSSNILSVIEEQYKRITSRIELVDDSGDNITVRYRSHCNATELQERNICTDLRTGDLVSFEVEVEATGCPKQKNHTIHLKDVLTSETVRLDVEILCACDCDQAEEVNSDKCSGVGTLRCGVCNCPDNRAGWNCECTGDLGGQTCRPDNSSSSGPECSGRGDCVCGKCECDSDTTNDPAHVIGGQYCECDSLQCDRAPDGSICGGELHGHCECDQCVCRPGWTGDDCTCTNDTRNCAPANTNSGLLCYGKGDCNCGRCHCYNTERGRYAGQFCEDCPTCRGLCRTYQPCAQCSLRSGAAAALNCSSCDESYVIALRDQLAAAEKGTVCRFQDAVDGCFYQFQYYSDENGRNIINVLKSKECYEVDVLAIVLGTVGAVVAVGLATLLLWRLFTYVSDRHEYARFEQEQKGAMAAASTNNELYHSPITKYTVPDDVKLFGEDD